MEIVFTKAGFEDLNYWSENDLKTLRKLITLINSIRKDPFTRLGKPESLKYDYSSCCSRRINQEHRLIYKIKGTKGVDQTCIILQCRFHY